MIFYLKNGRKRLFIMVLVIFIFSLNDNRCVSVYVILLNEKEKTYSSDKFITISYQKKILIDLIYEVLVF